MKEIKKTALFDAVATAAYVIVVACFLYFGTLAKFGHNSVLAPITMLMLFVLSAAVTSFFNFLVNLRKCTLMVRKKKRFR